ncbi:CopD family protein [Thioclava nitratireducens]|uniref:CopD family protein n=1 Tax=Thioclava nitratireducens TaxID=1915078 RepID=UPI002480841B|nr:CopD family protein [Thioclava nitratireducens]WGT51998.1 CopD family protein [Thioclava nitratireducens]
MTDFLSTWYLWIKALHVMAIITWMAALFYLPRLYVYHVEGLNKAGMERDSDQELLFRHQERLLLKAIMNPGMIASWFFGLMLVFTPGIVDWSSIWPWTKAAAVLGMTWFHMWCAKERKALAEGRANRTGRYYRMMNEIPTIFMIVIVASVIVKF